MGGPGPSSRATSMKVAGTPSFNSCVFSAKPERKKRSETGQHYSMQAHMDADLKGGEWSLPRLAYMTKRLKYCCRWRPCSDTSLLSRLSTARNKCSLKLKLSQLWDKRTNHEKCIRTYGVSSKFQTLPDFPWMREAYIGRHTWLEVPGEAMGEGQGPSCKEKCAINTMSLEKAPRTSALGHSSRYSEKRFGYAKRTLCANQLRTFLLCRSKMHRASYLK